MSKLVSKDANFIASLILYQHRKDKALGLGLHHISFRSKGLFWYYQKILKDQQQKAFLVGLIWGYHQEIKKLVKKAKEGGGGELIAQAEMLFTLVKKAEKKLKTL